MKKSFLLGLAAMLLPLATWAQAIPEAQFVIAGIPETKEITYAGDLTAPEVTVKYYDGEEADVKELQPESSYYEITYTLNGVETDGVRNVGKYVMTVKGTKGVYAKFDPITVEFEVTPKEIKDVSLTDGAKIGMKWGDDEKALLVENLAFDTDLAEASDEEAEKADLVNCLKLKNVDGKEIKVGAETRVFLEADEENENQSNYRYVGYGGRVALLTIEQKEVTVTAEGRDYNGTETDAANFTAEDYAIEGVVNGEDVAVVFESKKIKDAGEYELTASLIGEDAKNYVLSNTEVAYTVNKVDLTITPIEGKELKKTYGEKDPDFNDGYFDFDGLKGLDSAESLGLEMKRPAGWNDVNDMGYTVWIYLYDKQLQSTEYSTALTNYNIIYTSSEANYRFHIEPKTITWYFKGEESVYDAKTRDVADCYKVEIEDGVLDEDKESVTITEPTAKFEEGTTVKDAGNYDLLLDEAGSLSGDKAENYTLAESATTGDGKNVYVISKAKAGVNVKEQTLAFGVLKFDEDGELDAEIQKKWRSSNQYTDIALDSSITGNDRSTDANLIRSMLTFSIINEDAKTGESGEYEEAIQANIDTENTNWNDAQQAILKNYDFTYNKAKLTISDVAEILVLDGNEDADNMEEGENTILENLTELNGAIVDSIEVKNLQNFVTDLYTQNIKIKAEQWYTLILPFEVTVRELSEKFGYAIVNIPDTNNDNEAQVRFKLTMKSVPANTLMAFKVDQDMEWDDEVVVGFSKKKIVAPTDEWETDKAGHSFVGVYTKQTLEAANDYYLWPANGAFYDAASVKNYNGVGFEVYPLNGYVHAETPNAKIRILMEELDGTTTAISAVTGEVIKENAEGWYTISGVKLNAEPTEKGIYINNGKKVVIK